MKPFTDNIIFWDSEFSSLDPYKGELLSLGMVKPTGEELYFELDYKGEVDPWVQEHIVPQMVDRKVSRETARMAMDMFVGDSHPFMISYVNQFDTVYLYKFLGVKNTTREFKFSWIQIDFASMLFAMGYDPEMMSSRLVDKLCVELQIDSTQYRHHHALDDAKLLKEVYMKILKK